MVSKNQQKIGEANGMPSLPTRPTQVTKTGNVGSVDVFRAAHLSTFGPRGQGNAKNRGSQWYAQSAHCVKFLSIFPWDWYVIVSLLSLASL